MLPKIAPWRPIVNRALLILSLQLAGCPSSTIHPGDQYLHEATAAREAGDLQLAKKHAQLAIEDGRREREARELLASIIRNQARDARTNDGLSQASALFFQAADVEPTRHRQEQDIRDALAATKAAQLPEQDLLKALERALQTLPLDLDIRLDAARSADDLGHAQIAIDHYLWLLSADPENSQVALRLGVNFLNVDRPKDAAALLKRLYDREPQNFQAAINLITALERLDRPDQLRALFDTLQERFPDQPGLLFRLANFEESQGNHARAQELRQQAQQASPAIEERQKMRPLR